MESSIAEFLKRQLACELLPTTVCPHVCVKEEHCLIRITQSYPQTTTWDRECVTCYDLASRVRMAT